MKLIINWQNATRARPERDQIEAAYKARLLELCGDADTAQVLKEDFHRRYEPPAHKWQAYNMIAAEEATAGLLPSEKVNACFTVRFEK